MKSQNYQKKKKAGWLPVVAMEGYDLSFCPFSFYYKESDLEQERRCQR